MTTAAVTANLDGLAAVFTQLMTWIGSLVTNMPSETKSRGFSAIVVTREPIQVIS